MKAYFTGVMMSGLGEISDRKPELYFAVPKDLSSCLFEKELTPKEKPDFLRATFRFKGMIPVYELVNID